MGKFLLSAAFCAALVLALNGVATAKSGKGGSTKAQTYQGTVLTIRSNMIVISTTDDNGRSMRVSAQVTSDTTVTVNGQPATTDNVSKGENVSLTVTNFKATTIAAQ
jgi:hypothetical protein